MYELINTIQYIISKSILNKKKEIHVLLFIWKNVSDNIG